MTLTAHWTKNHSFTSGGGNIWTRDSGLPQVFRIVSEREYSEMIGKSTGIRIDGKPVPREDDHAESGSVKIKLKANCLETLNEGAHILTAVFDDGSADEKFTTVKSSVNPSSLPRTETAAVF